MQQYIGSLLQELFNIILESHKISTLFNYSK
ncbi:hypothetical protein SACOL0852 [Staphylococcus aureus subsp. aureus COL]|uniref:Uncharacterized protein n=1 Tax=Staphylococcus aureus (strain COL) TaxID=93062 RepID=A0A0H2X3K3_STAAC|nr:hypothetical protein SACOL0852 [Staphylococcus aureus subsp. aureus COL]